MRRSFASLVVVLASAAAFAASDAPVTLQWSAPAECPKRDDVLASVSRLLGGVASNDDVHVDARATIDRTTDGRLRLQLETIVPGAAPGHRTIVAEQCGALADAAALIIAMTVNPARVSTSPTPTPSPSPSPPPAPSPSPSPSPAPAPSPAPSIEPPPSRPAAPRERVHLVAALGPLLDVGTAPMATFATALSIGATYRIFALEATSALAPSQSYAPPSGTLRASFAWQSFGARAAVRVGFAFAFLGVDVTRVRARGESGVDVPTSGAITRAAATIGAGARFTAIGPLGLRVEGELLLPRTKPRYVVATDDGAREVDTSGAVAFRTRISLEIVW